MYDFSWIYDFLKKWNEDNLYKTNLDIKKEEFTKFSRICSDENTLSWPILTKNDESFQLSLESWIRSLVLLLIESFWLITIWSCEWHKHLSNKYNISKRFVKILWRNDEEYIKNYHILLELAQRVNINHQNIKIWLFDFKEKFPDNNEYHLCFIVFIPFINDHDIYFKDIDIIYNDFLMQFWFK